MVTARKRLGFSPHAYCLPLVEGLQHHAAFELSVDATTRNAVRLRERELDAAFLTPIDYARESSEYQIVPAIAVSSCQGNDTIVLHFREGLRDISTLAVNPSSTSEIILAKILLAEKFDVEPTFLPVSGSLADLLAKGDAALLVGDQAVEASSSHLNKLDLVDEWVDLVELPYIHGVWCGREDALQPRDIARIQQAKEDGMREMEKIAAEAAMRFAHRPSAELTKAYLESFSFDFTEDVRKGLDEFLRYAYYYGVLPDVADLHFFDISSIDTTGPDELSLN